MIAEQAGGMATDGTQRVMEIDPTGLHQRIPYFTGSVDMVENVVSFLAQDN